MKGSRILHLLIPVLVWAAAMGVSRSEIPATSGEAIPVLVELFTSEGYRNCPDAEALLVQLQQIQPIPEVQIIALPPSLGVPLQTLFSGIMTD